LSSFLGNQRDDDEQGPQPLAAHRDLSRRHARPRVLLGGWGGANDDLAGDGTVCPADLALLLSQW